MSTIGELRNVHRSIASNSGRDRVVNNLRNGAIVGAAVGGASGVALGITAGYLSESLKGSFGQDHQFSHLSALWSSKMKAAVFGLAGAAIGAILLGGAGAGLAALK